ncbi:DUF1523 family protein [Roseovarius sp.]|uniref:DUF1523 family protein n=1 Tax=Roseovarius sp. TaxID=1486281 RepID=UPI00260FFE95|nr:DUF1523 family protein [Roseovarius sp.]
MGYVKWAIRGLFWLLVIAFLHYTLPQHDVARITDTYEKRVSPGSNAMFWSNADTGEATDVNVRDVFFVQAFRTDDKPMIYRNEDTGWGWPPYFKFDTSNLQAEASDLISKKNDANPQWVVVRHYGWRNEFLSIYPNAVSIWAVESPDVRIIPWVKIVLLTLLAGLYWAIRVRWMRFRKQRIEPKVDEWTDGWA